MDIQFWIYLIIIVITLIARATRKAKPAPRQEPEQDQDAPARREGQGQRPLTFEELLKEIQSAKEIREVRLPPTEPVRPYRQPEPTYQEVDYDDNIGEEEQDLETVVDEQKTTDIYEKAKQQAFVRPSLEETMKLEDTVVRFGQFKGYESTEPKSPMFDFVNEIKDPEGFRKAFIMSEILTRKY